MLLLVTFFYIGFKFMNTCTDIMIYRANNPYQPIIEAVKKEILGKTMEVYHTFLQISDYSIYLENNFNSPPAHLPVSVRRLCQSRMLIKQCRLLIKAHTDMMWISQYLIQHPFIRDGLISERDKLQIQQSMSLVNAELKEYTFETKVYEEHIIENSQGILNH